MKHEIWVSEGQVFAHHFRISVIDTLIVNVKGGDDKRRLVFTRLNGPKVVELHNHMEDVIEKRLCYQWANTEWQNGALTRKTSLHWIPCQRDKTIQK